MSEKILTAQELQAIRERAAAATPGPWYDIADPVYSGARHRVDNQIVHWANFSEICYASADNAAFIAHSREDVDRLLFTVERYMEVLEHCGQVIYQAIDAQNTTITADKGAQE